MIHELKVRIKTVHEGVTKKLLFSKISNTIFIFFNPKMVHEIITKIILFLKQSYIPLFQIFNASNETRFGLTDQKLWPKRFRMKNTKKGSRAECDRCRQNAEFFVFFIVGGLSDLRFRFRKKTNAQKITTHAIL
jgi:hypothetical protein